MPTASEFRSRADDVRGTVAALTDAWSAIDRRRADTGLSGGRIADSVGSTLAASIANTSELARRCDAVIEELLRRAKLCEQFTAETVVYERRLVRWAARRQRYFESAATGGVVAWPGAVPVRPTPPFPRAEAG